MNEERDLLQDQGFREYSWLRMLVAVGTYPDVTKPSALVSAALAREAGKLLTFDARDRSPHFNL